MKRWILAALLLAAPASAQVLDPTGAWGVWTPDRSTTATLGALNAAATLQLAGREGAGFQLITANLSATVKPQVSFDNGTTWLDSQFVTIGGALSSTIVFSGGSSTQQRSIVVAGGVSHVRVIVSAYTSGTSTAIVRNTAASSFLLSVGTVSVTQGTSPWVVSNSGTFAVQAAQSGTWVLGANSGVDVGDVTINNAAGASAVNIQDGGNSLTVDNAALSVVGGGAEATALRVTVANDSTGLLSVDDNGGSLTVDAPAGTPVAVRPSDGSAFKTPFDQDMDSGAGTVSRQAFGLAIPDSGGPTSVNGDAASHSINVNIAQFASSTFVGVKTHLEDAAFGAGDNVVVAGAQRQDVPSSDTSGDGDVQPIKSDTQGRLWTHDYAPVATASDTGTCTTVATTSTTVLASDAARKGFMIKASETNTLTLFVKFGATATTSNMPIPPGGAFTMTSGLIYSGVIDAIKASGIVAQQICTWAW